MMRRLESTWVLLCPRLDGRLRHDRRSRKPGRANSNSSQIADLICFIVFGARSNLNSIRVDRISPGSDLRVVCVRLTLDTVGDDSGLVSIRCVCTNVFNNGAVDLGDDAVDDCVDDGGIDDVDDCIDDGGIDDVDDADDGGIDDVDGADDGGIDDVDDADDGGIDDVDDADDVDDDDGRIDDVDDCAGDDGGVGDGGICVVSTTLVAYSESVR